MGDPGVTEPFRIAIIAIAAAIGLVLCLASLGLTAEEREWLASRRFRTAGADYPEEEDLPSSSGRPALPWWRRRRRAAR